MSETKTIADVTTEERDGGRGSRNLLARHFYFP